ncbi:MAG: AtpZ/AtpI family protein [Myxococcales bacterium]|nr:AtpZ/AtpI family protein [Myxococcales bacterium]
MSERADRRGDKEQQGRDREALRQNTRDLQRLTPLLTAAWQLVAAVLLPTLLGLWLDQKLGTGPWLLLVGILLGIAVGLFGFIRTALATEKSQGNGRPPQPPSPESPARPLPPSLPPPSSTPPPSSPDSP